MKVNDNALHHYATSRPADRQGSLSYQPPKDSAKTRHFKLIGNLLFYCKVQGLSEDMEAGEIDNVGLMVIERCDINRVGERGPLARMFYIIFGGESSNKKHYFTAATVQECEEWVNALKMASYGHMRAELDLLRKRIKGITGADPWNNAQKKVLTMINQNTVIAQRSLTARYKAELPAEKPQQVAARGKNKSKGGSTFYTGPSAVISRPTTRHTEPKTKAGEPIGSKSQFFTQLEVIKANSDKSRTEGNRESQRVVSVGIDELRRKAMTLSQSSNGRKAQPPAQPPAEPPAQPSSQPSDHVAMALRQTSRQFQDPTQGRASHRSAIYDQMPGLDLLDFSEYDLSLIEPQAALGTNHQVAPPVAWPSDPNRRASPGLEELSTFPAKGNVNWSSNGTSAPDMGIFSDMTASNNQTSNKGAISSVVASPSFNLDSSNMALSGGLCDMQSSSTTGLNPPTSKTGAPNMMRAENSSSAELRSAPPGVVRTSFHGHMTPLIPCASGTSSIPTSQRQGVPPYTSNQNQSMTAQVNHHGNSGSSLLPSQMPMTNQKPDNGAAIDPFDLSFLDESLKPTNVKHSVLPPPNVPNQFQNWEKF